MSASVDQGTDVVDFLPSYTSGRWVRLWAGGSNIAYLSLVPTDGNGRFEIYNVPNGTYVLASATSKNGPWTTEDGAYSIASNPASSLSSSLMTKTIQLRGAGYYKEYTVVGDTVTDDSAILNTAYADAVSHNASFFLPGAIMALGSSLTWNGQMNVIGTGKLSTRFWAGGAIDMIVLGAGNTNARISGFSVDGRFLANHGFKTASSGGAATLMRFADIEISQCTGTPGTAFEVQGLAMNTCLFDEVKMNNNNKGLVIPATGDDSNTNANAFLKCNFSHNTQGNVLLGDDTAIMSGWQFFGCIFQHTGTDPAQDNIKVKGCQSLLLSGSYHEFTGGAASTAVRISSSAAKPSIVIIDGMYAAGGTNAANAVVIDAGATGSIVEVRGMQTNGITGLSVLDNSAASAVWKGASIEQGGLVEAYYNRVFQFKAAGGISVAKVASPATSPGPDLILASGASNSDVRFMINVNTGVWKMDRVGHLDSLQTGAPASTNKGANVTSVTATGNDVGGSLAIVMAGALAANTRIATLTWANSYGGTAPLVIALINQTSGAGLAIVNFYATPSTGVSFDLFSNQALAAGTYTVAYFVIGAA